jgi:predicted aldo/keto reductase-like oxidoreductase
MMPTLNLGETGFRVGIFSLGGQSALEKMNNEAVALPVIERALELGVNYFDTSAIYGGPERWSERYLGQGIKKGPPRPGLHRQQDQGAHRRCRAQELRGIVVAAEHRSSGHLAAP